MADNIIIKDGTGTNVYVSSDDIASVQYPRHKSVLGLDGVANDAVDGVGTVGAGVQRVTLATDVPLPTGNNTIGRVSTFLGSGNRTVVLNLTTNANGNTYTQFSSQTSSSLTVLNTRTDSTPLEVRANGTTSTLQIPINGAVTLLCANNTNEWEVRRQDRADTQNIVVGLAN